jgi:hypothetical protein
MTTPVFIPAAAIAGKPAPFACRSAENRCADRRFYCTLPIRKKSPSKNPVSRPAIAGPQQYG